MLGFFLQNGSIVSVSFRGVEEYRVEAKKKSTLKKGTYNTVRRKHQGTRRGVRKERLTIKVLPRRQRQQALLCISSIYVQNPPWEKYYHNRLFQTNYRLNYLCHLEQAMIDTYY
jgi:hypothetical protein